MAKPASSQASSLRPVIYSVLIFLCVTLITQFLSYQRYLLAKDKEHQLLLRELSSVEDRFRSILYNNITAANTLAIIYNDYGIGNNFDSLAKRIMERSKYIEAIQITEHGIIKQVYPLLGYEQTIGINTLSDSMRLKEEGKAASKNEIYFAGPRKLRQGGEGILGKVPLVSNGQQKGMVVVLTKLPVIMKALELGDGGKDKFAYVLVKHNVNGDTEQYPLTASHPATDGEVVSATIPEGDWLLQVAYSEHFTGTRFPNDFSIFSLLLSIIVSVLAYMMLREPYTLKKVIASKTHMLDERIKELSTIYKVNTILQNQDQSVEEVFTSIVELLPVGWQYPDVCVACIHFDGKDYPSKGYRASGMKQEAHFTLIDGRTGSIEVAYTAEMPDEAEGPFLKEERDLINSLAETIVIYFNKAAQQRELKESEARFRGAFEHASIGMALVSPDGRWIMVNRQLCNMVGYTEDELLKKTFQDVTHPDDIEKDVLLLRQTLSGEKEYLRTEKRYIHNNGAIVWVNLNVSLIRDGSDRPLYFVSQIENITDRVESQMKFRDLVEKSMVGVYILQKGRFAYANPRIYEESGYTEDELINMPIEQFVHRIDLPVVQASISAREHGATDEVRYEVRAMKKDGGVMWLEIFGATTLYNGEPAMIGTMVNITDKKAFYDDLIRSDANIQSMFNNSNVNYLLVDNAFTIVLFNDQFAHDYYQQTKVRLETGKNFIDLVIPERKAPLKAMFEQVMSTLTPIEYEVKYTGDTDDAYIYNTITPIINDGKPAGICLSGFDITNRKILELEREKMISDLIQRNNDLEQFSQIVSHNIRGPLATLLGLNNMLQESVTEEEKDFVLESIGVVAKRLDGVILDLNDILQVRRELSESKARVDLEQLVNDIKVSIAPMIVENKVRITTDFSAAPDVFTVRSYLSSIFYNLITNSIKHAQAGTPPHIEIWAEGDTKSVTIHVRDNGIGIDMEQNRRKIFVLYQRFNFAVEGKGLGLFMTKTQVEVLGGKIDVDSRLGHGSTFRVRLPV